MLEYEVVANRIPYFFKTIERKFCKILHWILCDVIQS